MKLPNQAMKPTSSDPNERVKYVLHDELARECLRAIHSKSRRARTQPNGTGVSKRNWLAFSGAFIRLARALRSPWLSFAFALPMWHGVAAPKRGDQDPAFNLNPAALGQINSIAAQPDGKVLIGGYFNTSAGRRP
jgi:hypothetical protein